MSALTRESIQEMLGSDVEEIVFVVAKSCVLGMDSQAIAATLGINEIEIDSLVESQTFKDVRLLLGAEFQREKVERDSGWDGLENTALTKLQKRIQYESNPDTLARIAAVANRATRRVSPNHPAVLDAAATNGRVPLTLTRRFTEKLQAGQVVERTETQQVSVLDGSAVNPTFEELQRRMRTPIRDSETRTLNWEE